MTGVRTGAPARGRIGASRTAAWGWLLLLAVPSALGAGVAIVGGTLHSLEDDTARVGVTVLVDDGVVQAVGANLTIPEGFERVDAAGKVVTPGFIESYSQLGLVEIEAEPSTVDALVSHVVIGDEAGVERVHLGPAFDVQYAINPDSVLLPVNLIAGVTRAVVAPLPGNDPLGGWGAAIRLADPSGGGRVVVQPRLALFGRIDAQSALFVGGSRSAVVQRLRNALDAARGFRPSRYQPSVDDYSSEDMSALRAFLDSDAPLVLSVQRANEIRQALALASEFGVRLVIHGGAEAWKVADALAAADVPVIVDVLDNIPLDYDRLGARIDNAALLWRAGVRVLFTAEETQNARLLRQVAGNAVAEGMPWEVALAGVTRLPAETFGLAAGTGTLGRGAPADLVIWSGDPLELTTWPERVMVDGAWVSMQSRQTRLLERYRNLQGATPYGYR